MTIKNYRLTGVSNSLEYGKRGPLIKFSEGSFRLENQNGDLIPLIVGSGTDDNSVATKSDLSSESENIMNSPIKDQVITLTGEITSNSFPEDNTIINVTSDGTLRVKKDNNDIEKINNETINDEKYWKASGSNNIARNIYVQESDPSNTETVPEGSIWFRI